MRHGVAVEREEWNGDDFHRPLTPKGHDKTREAARGLASLCPPPTLIATSPKVRALQTAELVCGAWKKSPPLEIWPELAEDDFETLLTKLRALEASTIVLVGHEPNLSRFASLLLTGDADTLDILWKKAGVMSLDLDPVGAALQWMYPPRILQTLAS